MIQRRRPIESAIAERKMFNMGGMAASMPQPTYMDLMQQPMGMPQQPQGIMASSQPLVDAIAADANNPAGGDTLSMAQGGAVGFANGGLGRTQSQSMAVPYATSEQMRSAQLSADKQARLKREEELRQVPADTQFTQQARLSELAPPPDYFELGGDPYASRAKVLAKNVLGGGINTVLALADTAPIIGALSNLAFSSPQVDPDGNPLPRPTANMETAAAKFMGRVPVELQPLASEVIQKLYGSPTAQEFLQSAQQSDIMGLIAETVDSRLSRSEAPDQAQAPDTPEAIERARFERINSGAPDQADAPYTPEAIANSYLNASASGELDTRYGGDENTPELDTRNEFLTEVASTYGSEIADSAGALIASANAPSALSQGDVISDEALASGVAALDEEADTRAGEGQRGDGGAAAALLEAAAQAQATADPAVVDPAVVDPAGGDTSAAMPVSPEERPSATDTGGGAAAVVAKVFDKPDMTKDDATKSMAQYKEEFLAQMPKYEGMSEEEKGFAFIEAGLRVMAGQSPNAITNIAKGLQGLGPAFAKDAKEKRAWNRQVELSAAKYALSGAEKSRTEERALAAEGRKRPFELIATKDFTMDGVKIERGTAVPLTNQQITDGYLNRFPLTYRETFVSDAKALANIVEKANRNLIKPQLFSADRGVYLDNARSVKNGIRMKGLLMEAAKIAIPEGAEDSQVLGAIPLFKSWVNKGLNAAGYQDTTEGRTRLSSLRSTKPDEYRTLMKTIGTTMVTEILNESNKTISEGDRARVDELVAAYSDYDGTVASYRSLLIKLNNLEKTIDSGIANASTSMLGIEKNWGDAQFVGGGGAQETLSSIRNFSGSSASYRVGDRSSTPIPYKDIINMETRKFTPKYQNIFGKKASN